MSIAIITGGSRGLGRSMALNLDGRMDIYLGIALNQPCPTCVGDTALNDGLRLGTCSGGSRNGLACDATATDSRFGDLSLECPPSPATAITTPDSFPRDVVLSTGTSTLTAELPCEAPLGALNCPCDLCGTSFLPCASNADCPPGAACKAHPEGNYCIAVC